MSIKAFLCWLALPFVVWTVEAWWLDLYVSVSWFGHVKTVPTWLLFLDSGAFILGAVGLILSVMTADLVRPTRIMSK